MKYAYFCAVIAIIIGFCIFTKVNSTDDIKNSITGPSKKNLDIKKLTKTMQKVANQSNVGGVAIGIIRNGTLVHISYLGEAAPNVPITKESWFNTASVAKTLIAETVLRMVARNAMTLDDPIGEFFRHHDLSKDPRYELLTPRLILSHQTTLLNWPSSYNDGRLAFMGQPGDGKVSYSGAAIDILMRYLEKRFKKPYPILVQTELLNPLNITGISVTRNANVEANIVRGINSEGEWQDAFRQSQGGGLIKQENYSAADNMFATIPGYAALLLAIITNTDSLPPEIIVERQRLLSSGSNHDQGYDCPPDITFCPDMFGHGLGWIIFKHGEKTILNHSGNDFAEHAQIYFDPIKKDGVILFINGGNIFHFGLEIISTIDPDLPMLQYYNALIKLAHQPNAI